VTKLHKKIDINNLNQTEDRAIYNAYLNELEKDLSTSSNLEHKSNNQRKSRIDNKSSDEMLEDDFRSKSLVKLEDKEYTDQIVTTTTTIHTMTTQDIFMQFEESNYYDYENQFHFVNSSNNLNSKTSNSNIYSCLTNYFSNNNSNANIRNFNNSLI
jgi:hypothetical protein